jgi:hypothetical protein
MQLESFIDYQLLIWSARQRSKAADRFTGSLVKM